MKNTMKALTVSFAAAAAIGLFTPAASAHVSGTTNASGAGAALMVPSCVEAYVYDVSGPETGVSMINHCSYTVNVYAIWDWAPDSTCRTIAPGRATTDESLGWFAGLGDC